jgi:hypothetical protein
MKSEQKETKVRQARDPSKHQCIKISAKRSLRGIALPRNSQLTSLKFLKRLLLIQIKSI